MMTDKITAEIIAAAEEACRAFEKRTRSREAGGEDFYALKDGYPGTDDGEWIHQLVFAAHDMGGMLPEDWRYKFVYGALVEIGDASEDQDIYEVRDQFAEPDIYTDELTSWLASRNDRYGYCDEAAEDFGPQTEILKFISLGQMREKEEVFDSVLSSLETRVQNRSPRD